MLALLWVALGHGVFIGLFVFRIASKYHFNEYREFEQDQDVVSGRIESNNFIGSIFINRKFTLI